MKNNWKETFRNDYTTKGYGDYRLWNESGNNVQKVEDFITNLLAEQKKGLLADERRFILNVLDGIDIADKKAGVIGGTQAIRQALQSRVI